MVSSCSTVSRLIPNWSSLVKGCAITRNHFLLIWTASSVLRLVM